MYSIALSELSLTVDFGGLFRTCGKRLSTETGADASLQKSSQQKCALAGLRASTLRSLPKIR